tara:strand:- start:2514 stop:5567 length:3054 start_codon:yes stop_codon:yes gene_type:complete
MKQGLLWSFLVITLTGLSLGAQERPDLFGSMRAREIGPAGMSGRVSDVEVVLADRNIIYVGGATGGLFRSENGGISWTPIFDDQDVLGIGAIAVFQPNPDIVWVGTGEGNPRNSAGVGRGLFKSIDGGHTWRLMGLRQSERIHRIITHPTDPDIVYVGVMGPAWSDGQERGLYRTLDGGRTWDRILWQNPRSGIADVVMDPSNPDKLFAAMWEFRRDPWFLTSGGQGSGLFVTYNGGDSWEQLTSEDGLPGGQLGRIGLAIAQSNPNVVYALVEAEKSALIRSDDGGRNWVTISDNPGINPRPFYYADIRVDPTNENRIYRLHGSIDVSQDQGRNWETVVPSQIIHGDVHELWIDPENPQNMILGEDGGIAFTADRGDTWRFVENLPLAQFYHISVDNALPFNIYGGLQDNGSWYGPSTVWENKGILNAHWFRVGGGDGFSVMPDFSDPDHFGYSMSQGGNLQHFDKMTGARRSIRPVHPDGDELRFNWNAGLTSDPFQTEKIYLGSQYLHQSTDQGRSWQIISPDLTTDDPVKQRHSESGGLTIDASGAETHTTIISIGPSFLEEGLIWVGTDDGNVQITRDGGSSWENVRDSVGGLPHGIWIPDVQPSKHQPGRAYLVAEDHRRGDWTPHVYVTEDYGLTWASLSSENIDGFVHAIEEDPENPNLLFLGTEFGLRVSLDRGDSWMRYTSGVPAVPIRDLIVHPRDGDLVLGTHGRALIVLDDIRPLRELASDSTVQNAIVHVFSPPPAYDVNIAEAIGYRSTGHAMQQAETRPNGALISFWSVEGGQGQVTVTSESMDTVYSRAISANAGVTRFSWDLRPGGEADLMRFPEQMSVFPGTYSVTVSIGDVWSGANLEVSGDPRNPRDIEDLLAKREALVMMAEIIQSVDEAREELERLMLGVERVLETLDENEDGLREEGQNLREALRALNQRLFTGPECQGSCGGDIVASVVDEPIGRITGEDGAPSENTRTMINQAVTAAETIRSELAAITDGSVAAYRAALISAGYTPIGGAS